MPARRRSSALSQIKVRQEVSSNKSCLAVSLDVVLSKLVKTVLFWDSSCIYHFQGTET